MKRAALVSMVLVAVSLGAVSPARAQVQTGSILIKVIDEQGAVVPGATATVGSPLVVSGQIVATTDAGGVHRFPALVPGTYSIKVEMQGFRTVTRDAMIVSVGQTTPIDVTLKLAGVAETVNVTGESPVVDTTSANVSVTLSQQLLQSTPGGRDIWSLVEYKVPGLITDRPDVGGAAGGLQSAMTARGTPNAQNTQYLNGVNVGDPAAVGYSGFYYDYDAFEEVQVSTGSHDISVPGSGVFVNMATKTGGNKWTGRGLFAWEGHSTESGNVDQYLLDYGFRPTTNAVDFVSDVSIQAGGPIVDKLRFFGSFRDWRVHVNVPTALEGNPPIANMGSALDQTNITSGLVNILFQMTPNNRLTGFYTRQYYKKPGRFTGNSALTTTLSNSNEDDVFNIYQLLWNSVITPKLFMDARVSYNTIWFPLYSNGTQQSLTDISTGILLRNQASEQLYTRKRLQASATFQYFLDHALGGRHEFRFGVDHAHAPTQTDVHRIDDVTVSYYSATNTSSQATVYNTPVVSKATVDLTALFIQDTYTVKRLTMMGGLRYERLEGYLPAQSSLPSKWSDPPYNAFTGNLSRSFSPVRDIPLWHTAGPRFSAVYDVKGDGKTAIKFSAGRYYYIISTGTPNNVNPNFSVSRTYNWNDANHNLLFDWGEQTNAGTQAGGLTTSFDPNFKRPYTNEITAGVDHELIPNLRLSGVFTYRVERYSQVTRNDALPLSYWTLMKTGVDPGEDGTVGTADDGTFQYYDRSYNPPANINVITNDPVSKQTYKGLEITVNKRMSNRWQMLAGYTYSSSWFSGPSIAANPNSFIFADGPIFNDRPQQFKLSGSYTMKYDILVSGNLRVQGGPPITRYVSQRLTAGGSTSVNVEPVGSHRLSAMKTVDLRAAKTIKVGSRALDLNMDIFNLMNANTVWGASSLTGRIKVRPNGDPNAATVDMQGFLSPQQILSPRIVRFSAAFKF
jgi:hypothetical protein